MCIRDRSLLELDFVNNPLHDAKQPAILEKHECGNNIRIVFGGKKWGFIDFHLAEPYFITVPGFEFLNDWLHHSAFAAPDGIEHDDYRKRAVRSFCIKVSCC